MKKLNILLISMLGVVGFIAQAQAKIADSINQQETNPHFLFEKEKGEIYFGEWAQKTPDTSEITHTVFNTGKEVTTKLPDRGTVIYNVKGVSQDNRKNPLSGHFVADFDYYVLSGSMSNSSQTVGIEAKINDNGKFLGSARANGMIGHTFGELSGANINSLEGHILYYSDRTKDTDFFGTRIK
ncbi:MULTISPECIES: hypothetical protein [Xenorhabdus]|uniref:HphA C-terminal domain-containing protein n=1 Tax=Xenorhabdus ehlersii TaxID=290111 RepID=A0A2D0INH5_9GAMM|nr:MULTISPECIES: hypothetical protein [Xenorhabdus]MBC8949290.1 hypothetical protein [Xenorhabdus sp. TS4]PHM23341.1 hypothetical protein Xehl_02870 [Xenorhabdus ehlersii]RKE93394.1 hypothetical protein BDE27_1132 [Xenorhabdus ehlersii]